MKEETKYLKFIEALHARGLLTISPEEFDYGQMIYEYLNQKVLTAKDVCKGDFFTLKSFSDNEKLKNGAMQVMEVWRGCMTVKTLYGCMTKPYSDFELITNLDDYTLKHESSYFEDHRQAYIITS